MTFMSLQSIVGMGIRRRRISGAPSIVPSLGVIAANRTQYNTNTAAINQPYTSRRTHYATMQGAISNLKTVDINRVLNDQGVSTSGGAQHTIKRYIEYPEGVFTQVKWAGQPTVALNSGSRIVSDAINLTIPAGAKFWERTVVLTSATIPIIEMPAAHTALGLDDGNVSADQGNSGTIPAGANPNSIGCQAILGDVNASNARSFVIIGDSLAFGSLDNTGVGTYGGSGWIARLLDNAGIPYTKWATGGMRAFDAATLSATLNADAGVFGAFTDVICEYGLNDLRLSRTAAQILADQQTLYTLANFAGKRIWQSTITPRSTSTDAWATVKNQTPQTDGTMASLASLNASIRAVPANVFRIIEAADAAMSGRDSGKHKAPPIGTADGTHFNSVRAALVASWLDVNLGVSPRITFADTFDRDQTTPATFLDDAPISTSGYYWSWDGNIAGGVQLEENNAHCETSNSVGTAYFTPDLGSTDMYLEYAAPSILNLTGPFNALRLVDRNNFVGVRTGQEGGIGTGVIEVYKRVNGTFTMLYTSAKNQFVQMDVIRLEVQGDTWKVYKNGVLLSSGSIGTTFNSRRAGLVARTVSGGGFSDEFKAAAL